MDDFVDIWSMYNKCSNRIDNNTTKNISYDQDICKHENTFYDAKNGLNVCTSCGDTLPCTLDESPEWMYARSSEEYKRDPSRCGCPLNPLLEKSSMSTMIKSKSYSFMNKLHHQMSMDHVERSLFHVFEQITRIAIDKANLPTNVIEQAKYYYKIISERKLSRGDIRQGLIACCILYACKYYKVSRSSKEISQICDIKVTLLNKTHKIFIHKMYDILEKDHLFNSQINTNDMIPRYCNSLTLDKDLENILLKKVYLLDNFIKDNSLLDGKTPSSVVCGIIIYICKLNSIHLDKKKFVKEHNISIVTVNKVVKAVESFNIDILYQLKIHTF